MTGRPSPVPPVRAVRFADGALWAIDQTRLPGELSELELRDAESVAAAIRRLAIRGAPLIGVAAGYGLALALARDPDRLEASGGDAGGGPARPRSTSPMQCAGSLAPPRARVATRAPRRRWPRRVRCTPRRRRPAPRSAATARTCSPGARRVLTHCNAGALAAPGRGTALAVIAELHDRGGLEHVLTCETRPLLQGARLTAWELGRAGIPHALIVDGAAAGLIAAGAGRRGRRGL